MTWHHSPKSQHLHSFARALQERTQIASRIVGVPREMDGDGDVATFLMDEPDDFLRWWANPEQAFFSGVLADEIMNAINNLPESFRVTILLVNVEGLTYDEAAEALGVPKGTVRSRMKRGRTLLQKALWLHARDAGFSMTGNMGE